MSIEVKGTATQRDYNRQLERVYLDKFFDAITPGEEFVASYKSMAELTQVPANIVSNVMQMLDKNGVLKRRFEYHGHAVGTKDAGGRTAYWTILTTKEHAANLLAKHQANMRSGPKPAPKTNGVGNPVPVLEAIDKNRVIEQSKAWVEKCRAYMKASDLINDNLAALKAAGIDVDETAYLSAISMKHDERLSAIALVIPYIDSLEKKRR